MFTKKWDTLFDFSLLLYLQYQKYQHSNTTITRQSNPSIWSRLYESDFMSSKIWPILWFHRQVQNRSKAEIELWRLEHLPCAMLMSKSTELYLKTSAITDVKDFDALVMMSLLLNWHIIFFWQRGFFSANILNQKVEKPIMLAIRFWDRSRRLRLLPGGMTMLSIFTAAFELVSPGKLYI